jgi:hypothetical protein
MAKKALLLALIPCVVGAPFIIATLIIIASIHTSKVHARQSSGEPSTTTSCSSPSRPCSQPATTPPYDAAAIVTDAEQAYRANDYAGAVVLLSQLHTSDLNQPKTHALWNSASGRLDHQKSVQEASDRAEYASDYESALLGAGIDATVRSQGIGNKTLYVSTPLMSRPLVYQIMNPDAQANSDLAQGHVWQSIMDDRTDLPSLWKSKGFERLIFTDGYETE